MTSLETLLGYIVTAGLLAIPVLGLLHGYYLVTAPPATETNNPLLTPTGPFIAGTESPPPGSVVLTNEYRTTSTLLWGMVALTAGALVARIHLHMQDISDI